jgi:hypothetical protein
VPAAVRLLISQPFADDTRNRSRHTLGIPNTQSHPSHPLILPEIKFGQKALQALLADVVIGPGDSPLIEENPSIVFV